MNNTITITRQPDGNFKVDGPDLHLISDRPNFVSEMIRLRLVADQQPGTWEENLTSTAKAALTRLRALKIKPEFEREAIELLHDETPKGLAHVVATRGLADVIEDLPKSVASSWFEPSDDQLAGWARQALTRLRELMIKPEYESDAIQVLSAIPLREHLDWIENAREERREWFQRGERVIESLTPPNAFSGEKFSAGSILIRLRTSGIKPEFEQEALTLVQLSGPDKADELLRELPMTIHPEWFDQNRPPVRIEAPTTTVPEVAPSPDPLPWNERLNALTLQKNCDGDFVLTGPNTYAVIPVAEAMRENRLTEALLAVVGQLLAEPRSEMLDFTPIPCRIENQAAKIRDIDREREWHKRHHKLYAEQLHGFDGVGVSRLPDGTIVQIAANVGVGGQMKTLWPVERGQDSKTHFTGSAFWQDLLPETDGVPTLDRPLVVEFGHGRILIGTFRRKSTGAAGVYFKEVDQGFKIGELPKAARTKDRGFLYLQFANQDSIKTLIDSLQFVLQRHPLPKSTNVVQHFAADLTFTERKRAEALALEWLSICALDVTPFNVITALSAVGHFATDEEDETFRELRKLWGEAQYGSRTESGKFGMERFFLLNAEPAEKIAAILSPTFAEEADRMSPFAGAPMFVAPPPPYDQSEMVRFVAGKIGEASMCWHPRPTGVFESRGAQLIAEQITDYFLEATQTLRSDLEAIRGEKANWTITMETARRDVRLAREEAQKFRTAARVLCGAHIGKSQDNCPVCEWQKAEKELMDVLAALAKIEGKHADVLQVCSTVYRIQLIGQRGAELQAQNDDLRKDILYYGELFERIGNALNTEPSAEKIEQAVNHAIATIQLLINFAEQGWGVIANANGGNWETASEEWRTAAAKYRDEFHNDIAKLLPLNDPLRSYRKAAMDFARELTTERWAPSINEMALSVMRSYGEQP